MMPLWSSYLVKVYAWKLLLAKEGAVGWLMHAAGADRALDAWLAAPLVGGPSLSVSYTGMVLVFLYLWTPFMILPVQAALERVPATLIEASGDLGADPRQTFRHVILPLALPGLVAGSIFTFSLTLGDYIVPADRRTVLADSRPGRLHAAGHRRKHSARGCLLASRRLSIMAVFLTSRNAWGPSMRSDATRMTTVRRSRERFALAARPAAGRGRGARSSCICRWPSSCSMPSATRTAASSFRRRATPAHGSASRGAGPTSGRRWRCRSAVALVSTALALLLGTLAAAALARAKFFGREAISLLFVLPIALPGIVTGIALRSAFGLMDIPFSFWTIVLGHATFCIVVVYNNAVARFRRLSPSMVEASMDLGADGFQTFRHIVLPSIGTALLAGGMLAFALSFDEVIVTTFTAGQQRTLPIWMLSELDPPASAPGDQRRRRRRHRRHHAADSRRLLSDARRRACRRRRKIAAEPHRSMSRRKIPCSIPTCSSAETSSPAARPASAFSIRKPRS